MLMPLYKGHLICTKTGCVRYTKGASTKANEVAVAFRFELPAALFEKPVIPLTVQVDQVKPLVVTPELCIRAQEILEKELGVRVELTIPETACIYCNGTGVIEDNGERRSCVPCGGTGLAREAI